MFHWQNASVGAHSCFQPGNTDGQREQLIYISIHYVVLLASRNPMTTSINWEVGIFITIIWVSWKKWEFSLKNGWTLQKMLAISRPIGPWASLKDSTSCLGNTGPMLGPGTTNIWLPMLVYILKLHDKVSELQT